MADKNHWIWMAVLIVFGSLFSFILSWTAVSGENRDPIARVSVEDGRGFTRIVFPYEHPEEISIEPGPDRRRFVIRIPETEAEIIAPHVVENHHLIRRIEILPDPDKEVRVQVVLTNEFVDWVTYQYEYPPRKVLYLRASEDPRRTIGSRIGLPLAQETKDQKSKALKSPSKTPRTSRSQSHDSLELTEYLRVLRDATNSEKVVGKDPKSSRPVKTKSPPQKKKSSNLLKRSKVDRNKVAPKKRRAKKPKPPLNIPVRPGAWPKEPSHLAKTPVAGKHTGKAGDLKVQNPNPRFRKGEVHARPGSLSRLAENPRQTGSDSVAENLWRPSAEAVPEFIRPGPVYPPDFHEMKEDERKAYLQALEKFRQGDFSGAKEIISKIVPKDHRSSLAETLAFLKADCAFQRAEKGGAGTQTYMLAIQNFREAMTEFPQSRFVPYTVLMMATGYRRIKFFHEAVVQYEFFLTHFPEDAAASEALFWKAESLFQTGRYGDAKTVFGAFADRSPYTVHGRIAALRVGDCFYKMGDLKKARDEYGRVLSEPSDFSYYPLDSLLHAGLTFLENKDFKKGREILFRAVNLDPESKKGRAMMEAIAQSYLAEDLDEEALRVNLLLCQSLGGDDLRKMELLRLADLRLSRPKLKWPPLFVEAYLDPVGVYQDFLDHTQDMSLADEVMYRQALALGKRGDIHEAVGKLERILSLRHQDSLRKRSASLLSYSLNSLIQRHHGREDLEVVRLYKGHAFFLLGDENMDKGGLLLVAESLQNVGLLEDALAVYRHLRGVSSLAHDHVLFQIGRILILQGEKEAAREAFEDLSKSYPNSLYLPEVQKLLGDLCFGIGDYEAATQWYRLALVGDKVGPGMGRSYAQLGRALKVSGRYTEAMDAYQKAVDSVLPFKDQAWAREILAESLAEIAVYHEDHGRVLEAVESYGRIIGLSPPEDRMNWTLYRLGESYRKIGNTEMMEQTFEDLNQRSPDTLWSKLATQIAGGVAVESMVAPYIEKVGKHRPR